MGGQEYNMSECKARGNSFVPGSKIGLSSFSLNIAFTFSYKMLSHKETPKETSLVSVTSRKYLVIHLPMPKKHLSLLHTTYLSDFSIIGVS